MGQLTIDSLSEGAIQGLAGGEIVAVARMLGFASVAAFLKAMDESGYKLRCMPCKPPVGTQRQQCHDVEKGNKKHYKWPKHYHVFTVNQSPVRAGCRCFDKRTTVEEDPGFPPYQGRPRGGGIIATK